MPDAVADEIIRRRNAGERWRAIADAVGKAETSCRDIYRRHGQQQPAGPHFMPARLPEPSESAGGPRLPDPVKLDYKPVYIDGPGLWVVLGDVHLPFHDKRTVELAVEYARERNAAGLLLNGDILDSHEVSDHEKDRDALSYADELEVGRQFMAWVRSRLPRTRIVYREGNHEQRVQRYVFQRAPAIAGLEGLNVRSWLNLKDHGIEWVQDKRVVYLGKLATIHGHEYRGGGGVSPARWLMLRAYTSAMCGHFHRASFHGTKGLNPKPIGIWSHGCACYLHPAYAPLNEWTHGFASVELAPDGTFHVENKMVIDGRLT